MDLFANYFQWTVTAGGATTPVAGTSESFTVSSSTGAPAASNTATPATVFRIVDAADTNKPPEVMTVTNVSGTTWTVTRGAEGAAPWSHAANWTAVPVATAGALAGVSQLTLISRQVLAAPAGTVTFSSIPGTYENLILQVMGGLSDGAAAVRLQLNGDSTAGNYYWVGLNWVGNSSNSGSSDSSSVVGNLPGPSGFPAGVGTLRLTIPSYARTVLFKGYQAQNGRANGAGNGNQFVEIYAGWWSGTAAVTSISLTDGSGGNFITGSVFSLYGES